MEPSLAEARFKDPTLPCQRIVLVQALALTLIRRLADWLSQDALRFVILFPKAQEAWPLRDEAELLEILLLEQRSRGLVALAFPSVDGLDASLESPAAVMQLCAGLARTAQVHVLELGVVPLLSEVEGPVLTSLSADAEAPTLRDGSGIAHELIADEPFDVWVEALVRILQLWV